MPIVNPPRLIFFFQILTLSVKVWNLISSSERPGNQIIAISWVRNKDFYCSGGPTYWHCFLYHQEVPHGWPWPKQTALVHCAMGNNTRIGESNTSSSSLEPCCVPQREAKPEFSCKGNCQARSYIPDISRHTQGLEQKVSPNNPQRAAL